MSICEIGSYLCAKMWFISNICRNYCNYLFWELTSLNKYVLNRLLQEILQNISLKWEYNKYLRLLRVL